MRPLGEARSPNFVPWRPWLALVLLGLLTALPHLLMVPPTVKPDEAYHWAYAIHLAETGQAPPYISPQDPGSRETHQPPLYYGLAAGLSKALADPAQFASHVENPFLLATDQGNRNLWLLSPEAADLFAIGRWLSVLFWIALLPAVAWCWQPFLGIAGSLTAAAFGGLVPMLAFVGTAYNNDLPAVTFMALALGGLLRLLADRQHGYRWMLWFGVALGLSMLSKLYAVPLVAAVGLVAVLPFFSVGRRQRLQMLGGLALSGVILAPWLWSNWQRFGDPVGSYVFNDIMGVDPNWLNLHKAITIASRAWPSFWADLGPGGLDMLPALLAIGLLLLEVLAVYGAARKLREPGVSQFQRSTAWLIGLTVVLALLYFGWTFLRAEVINIAGGRNLLALHVLNAAILVFGLKGVLRSARAVRWVLVVTGLAMTLWAWSHLARTYPVMRLEPLAGQPAPLARFGDRYELLDWQVSRRSGRIVEAFTLAKVEQDDRQHALFLQLVAPDGRLLVNVNTYPAHGVLATAYWPPEAALHERYSIAIPGEMPPGSRLLLGLWTPATGQRLPARDPDGKPLPDDAFNALLPDPAP